MRHGYRTSAVLLALAGVFGLTAGCDQSQDTTPKDTPAEQAKGGLDDHDHAGHDDHSGWWCPEHGIPEEECSMCSAEAADKLKAKGDWCEKHDRAGSQCFICHPELKEKFAAKYRAKYGEEPPPLPEEGEDAGEGESKP